MIDLEQAAAALYGSTATTGTSGTPKSPTSKPPAPSADTSEWIDLGGAAQKLYGGLDGALNADGLDKVHHGAQRAMVEAGTERLGMSEAEAREGADHWAQVFRGHELGHADAAALTEVGIAALASPPDEATRQDWARSAMQALQTEFGDTHELALKDAKALIAADSQLAAFLDATGLGSHRDVVLAVAKRARHLRVSGRLK